MENPQRGIVVGSLFTAAILLCALYSRLTGPRVLLTWYLYFPGCLVLAVIWGSMATRSLGNTFFGLSVILPLLCTILLRGPYIHVLTAFLFAFSLTWVIAWMQQSDKGAKRIFGLVVGGGFVLISLIGTWSEYEGGRIADRFRAMDPGKIARIELQRPSERTGFVISSLSDIRRIVSAFRSIRPYNPNHEGMEDVLSLTLVPVAPDREPIRVRIANGTSASPKDAWLNIGGAGDYVSEPFRQALMDTARFPYWKKPETNSKSAER